MAEDQTCLVSRYSTDIHVSSGKPIKILVDENTVLGYAAKFKEGYEEDQVKKNVKIAHLSCTTPVVMKLCVPISYDRSFLGIVNIAERKNMEFTKEDSQFFSTVCNLLGLAIQNARNLRLIEDSLLRVEARMAQTTELNQRIRDLFGKFTSPNVVNALIENQADIQIGGENKEITILFCDIRGFTTYCEKRTPEEVVDILNEYLTKMSQVIIKYDGTLDKYIGDEIMAFWGAPLTQPQHARLAVQAGYEMMLELKKLEIAWRKAGREPFGMGIGINTGTSIVGNIGSNLRMDYTVIGDNVNLCSRVQSLTRKFNANFLITDHTYNYVKDIVKARKIGVLQVKGKSEPVMIFAVEWVDLKPLAG
jgi:class 3 adenylate cyclase